MPKYSVSFTVVFDSDEIHHDLIIGEAIHKIIEGDNIVDSDVTEIAEPNFIRMINEETGEVREVDATQEGLNALCSEIEREVKNYPELDLLKCIKFEGHHEYIQILEKKLKKSVK